MTSSFIWYELLTSDPDAAAAFYGKVIGWTATDSGQPGMDYRTFSMDDVAVGGFMALPPGAAESGMQPCWLGYVSVADVDQSLGSVIGAGGAEHMPPMDVPTVGRMAMVADPQGATFYVMTPIGSGQATSFAPGKPGHGGWNELHTRDWKAALAFYGARFGWQKVDAMDFNVADIEQAGKRVSANGGKVIMGPNQVPTGEWIINAQDPQGAMFALLSPKT